MKILSTVIPYLLLVSFYTGTIRDFGIDKIFAINSSPYNGVAVMIAGAYETGNFKYEDFKTQITLLKKYSKKDMWPWIFFNRFIGYDKNSSALSPLANQDYFRKIKTMDIYNKNGALDNFLNLFKISLKISRAIGSPGIVIDPEAYNNYKAYALSYVAKEVGISEEKLIERLKQIGQEMADIAAKEYPDAVIWFLFTGLSSPMRSSIPFSESKYRTVTYIIEGMLERSKNKKLKLKIISGGEMSLGYCYKNIEDLRDKLNRRNEKFTEILKKYPNLYLAGTISPWYDYTKKKNWMLKGVCGSSELKNIEDFKPVIKELLSFYQYIWIYAATAAEYDPYNPELASRYNKAIKEVLNETSRSE